MLFADMLCHNRYSIFDEMSNRQMDIWKTRENTDRVYLR